MIEYVRTHERIIGAEGRNDDNSGHPGNPGGARGQARIPACRHPAAAAGRPPRRDTHALPRHRDADFSGVASSASHHPGQYQVDVLRRAGLGLVAQLGGVAGSAAPVPDRLSVVQVQTGETLQHVAARVAPDAPVGQVVERIRELNQLESVALDVGQTLIAPVG